jgi:hypothetical protein
MDVLSADNTLSERQRRFLVTFCCRTKSYPLAAGQRKLVYSKDEKQSHWIATLAGITSKKIKTPNQRS